MVLGSRVRWVEFVIWCFGLFRLAMVVEVGRLGFGYTVCCCGLILLVCGLVCCWFCGVWIIWFGVVWLIVLIYLIL